MHVTFWLAFSGAFAKQLQKVTVSFVMPICETTWNDHQLDFCEILYWGPSEKFVNTSQFWIILAKNDRDFT
jgi:hypothetical protein